MKGREADTGKGDIWLDTSHRQCMLEGRVCCLLPHETRVILGGRMGGRGGRSLKDRTCAQDKLPKQPEKKQKKKNKKKLKKQTPLRTQDIHMDLR